MLNSYGAVNCYQVGLHGYIFIHVIVVRASAYEVAIQGEIDNESITSFINIIRITFHKHKLNMEILQLKTSSP